MILRCCLWWFLCLFWPKKILKKWDSKSNPPPPVKLGGTTYQLSEKFPRNAWDSCGWWCNHSCRWHKVVRRISTSRNSPPWEASGWLQGPFTTRKLHNELTWGAPTACWTPWIYLWGWFWDVGVYFQTCIQKKVQKTSISSFNLLEIFILTWYIPVGFKSTKKKQFLSVVTCTLSVFTSCQ